jgi:hypothetical protein
MLVYQRVNMDHGTHGMESLAAKTSLWMFWMFISKTCARKTIS